MKITYGITILNFRPFASAPSLERVIGMIRQADYGVELYPKWKDEPELCDLIGRRRVKPLVEGMTTSFHASGAWTFELHKKQIDTAVEWGAKVMVVHPCHLASEVNPSPDMLLTRDLTVRNLSNHFDTMPPDISLTRDVVAYANECGVRIALENSPGLDFVTQAVDKVDGLGICLDVGHVYLQHEHTMRDYLDALKDRLVHLHLQDILSDLEIGLPVGRDHYLPGTGGIPRADWERLAETLKDIDYHGMGVFEIQPRHPLQMAVLATKFMENLLGTE